MASLRAIDSIRQTGSVSITAQQLGLTQSAISRSIATLEEQLGLPLLHRGRRPLSLTCEGELVAQSATRIAKELDALQAQLDNRQRHRSGRVTIGSFGASASSHLLPHLLQRFHRKHPGIAVSVIDGDDQQTEKSLHEGLFDFAVLGKSPNEYDCISLSQDQLVGLVASEHALAKRKKLSAIDFHTPLCDAASRQRTTDSALAQRRRRATGYSPSSTSNWRDIGASQSRPCTIHCRRASLAGNTIARCCGHTATASSTTTYCDGQTENPIAFSSGTVFLGVYS